jgi:hypothetical protein
VVSPRVHSARSVVLFSTFLRAESSVRSLGDADQ